MTALAANKLRTSLYTNNLMKSAGAVAVKTSDTIYMGSLVSIVNATGRLAPATDGTGEKCVGVSQTKGTGDTDGTVSIEYEFGKAWEFDLTSLVSQNHLGCDLAVADDSTMTTQAGSSNTNLAGTLVHVNETAKTGFVLVGVFSGRAS